MGHVVGVGAHAIADDFGQDAGAAGPGKLRLLQHQHGRSLPHHKAVALRTKAAAGALRLVIPHRHRLHRAESAHADGGDRRLRAAGQHGERVPAADDRRRVAESVRPGGTGGDHAVVRPAQTQEDRGEPGSHIRDEHRDEERADPIRAALQQDLHLLLQGPDTANAGADQHADLIPGLRSHRQRRRLQRLHGGRHAKLAEAIHPPRLFALHPAGRIKVGDLTGDPRFEAGGIKQGDGPDPGTAGADPGPGGFDIEAQGCDRSQAGDYDAVLFHRTGMRDEG